MVPARFQSAEPSPGSEWQTWPGTPRASVETNQPLGMERPAGLADWRGWRPVAADVPRTGGQRSAYRAAPQPSRPVGAGELVELYPARRAVEVSFVETIPITGPVQRIGDRSPPHPRSLCPWPRTPAGTRNCPRRGAVPLAGPPLPDPACQRPENGLVRVRQAFRHRRHGRPCATPVNTSPNTRGDSGQDPRKAQPLLYG